MRFLRISHLFLLLLYDFEEIYLFLRINNFDPGCLSLDYGINKKTMFMGWLTGFEPATNRVTVCYSTSWATATIFLWAKELVTIYQEISRKIQKKNENMIYSRFIFSLYEVIHSLLLLHTILFVLNQVFFYKYHFLLFSLQYP